MFFHKFDPALVKNAPNEMNNLLANLKEKIKSIVNYKKLYFYTTSIYDLSSIINAISEILLALFPKSQLIEKTIAQFANKVAAEGAVILDDNSLIVGSYYQNDATKQMLNSSTPYFLTLNDSFKESSEAGKLEDQMVVQRLGKYFVFKQISLKQGATPYYLLLLKNTPEVHKEDYDSIVKLLREILYK